MILRKPSFPCGKYRQTILIYFLYFSLKSKNIIDIGMWWKVYHVEFIFSNVPYHKIESKFQRLDFIQKHPRFIGKLLYLNLKVSALRSITVCFSTQVFQKCKFQHLSGVESFSTQASKSEKFQHSGRKKFQHSNFRLLDL